MTIPRTGAMLVANVMMARQHDTSNSNSFNSMIVRHVQKL